MDKAVHADQVVKERYNTHCEMIALLCKPESELCAAIPSANPAKTLQGSEVKDTLLADANQISPMACRSHSVLICIFLYYLGGKCIESSVGPA